MIADRNNCILESVIFLQAITPQYFVIFVGYITMADPELSDQQRLVGLVRVF